MIAKFQQHIAAPAAIIVVAFMLFFPLYSLADVYRYIDKNQIIHLTNVPSGPGFRVLLRENYRGDVSKAVSTGFTTPYENLISETAAKYGMDDNLVKAIIKVESNFNHKAVSKKGARGLMQLMPRTAEILGVADCFHPQMNIDGGIRHLSYLSSLFGGNIPLTLAAYNAGEQAVTKYGDIPPYAETKTYVRQVMAIYEQYKKISAAKPSTVASLNQRRSGDNKHSTF